MQGCESLPSGPLGLPVNGTGTIRSFLIAQEGRRRCSGEMCVYSSMVRIWAGMGGWIEVARLNGMGRGLTVGRAIVQGGRG